MRPMNFIGRDGLEKTRSGLDRQEEGMGKVIAG